MSFWNAKRVMNASFPALCSVHWGRTIGAGVCVPEEPEEREDLSFGRESGGSVNEIRRCSSERAVPSARGFSVLGSIMAGLSPEEYRARSKMAVSSAIMLLGSFIFISSSRDMIPCIP